ncbi:hypothetical protein LSG31_09810 [Fodinisporobacter ferrooxydans]|uniref:Uncharacterized protein n=1 Tax=Fodinisporobacter ferrooxydans TaxID=2901836 RepID=A0ABY4CPM5_9BACL|nr:hypothetical protein LSG31_09810 [Alicyclobacillaceae bacterium MYW30-H2]
MNTTTELIILIGVLILAIFFKKIQLNVKYKNIDIGFSGTREKDHSPSENDTKEPVTDSQMTKPT